MSLPAGSIHIWHLDDDGAFDGGVAVSLLDEGEQQRWKRLHFGRDRHQFLQAHGLLRQVLSLYCGQPASTLRFERGPQGRPELPGAGFSFNLSHSGRHCLLAVARGAQVGIDVEVQRPGRRFDALARRCFDAPERAALDQLHGPDYQQRFYDLWSLKEAVIKASGRGLAMSLQDFTLQIGTAALWLDMASALPESQLCWRVALLRQLDGASAAMAMCAAEPPPCSTPRWFRCRPGKYQEELPILPFLDSSSAAQI